MRIRIAGPAYALLLFSALTSRAELWQSKDLNFSINLPVEQGWTQLGTPSDAIKVSTRSPDRQYVVSVVVTPADTTMLPEQFIKRFKKQWFKYGTSRSTSDALVQVDGQPASCIKDIAMLNGKATYRADTFFVSGRYFYQIEALGSASDPLKDTTVKELFASFHFLSDVSAFNPPPPAKRASNVRPLPFSAMSSNPANKIAGLMSDLTVLCLAVLFIAWVLSRGGRRNKTAAG